MQQDFSQTSAISEGLSVKSLSLRSNFSWTLLGNIVYSGCQWGMLVILAKLGSPILVGQFALGLAITAPVIMFANLQLRAVQATDANKEYLFRDYLSLRLIALVLSLIVITAIAAFSGYRTETLLVVMAVGIAKIFESISDVFFGLFQQHERMDRVAISMIIKGLLSLLVLSVCVFLTKSVLWGTLGLAAAWAVVLFSYDIYNGSLIVRSTRLTGPKPDIDDMNTSTMLCEQDTLTPRWDSARLTKLTTLTLPLGFVMLLISLSANIPRYFIEHYVGEWQLGIFAAMSYLMVAGTTIISALGQSASPRLAKYFAAGKLKEFSDLLIKLVLIGVLFGALGCSIVILAGKEILTLLYRPEYAQHLDAFLWIMIAAGINYVASFLGYAMTAARYFKVQVSLFSIIVGTLTLVCLWLVPIHGLYGAAIAIVVTAIVQAIGSFLTILFIYRKARIADEGMAGYEK